MAKDITLETIGVGSDSFFTWAEEYELRRLLDAVVVVGPALLISAEG